MKRPQTPYKTPSDFFDEQRTAIWNASEANRNSSDDQSTRNRVIPLRPPIGWAAAVASVMIASWVYTVLQTTEKCETFACLWEATEVSELNLSEQEEALWLEDDLLFEIVSQETESEFF